MYKTTLTKEELSALRAEGFIHVTGLTYEPSQESDNREFRFPQSQRGRWAQDRNGFIIAVLWNGEVWARYSDRNARDHREDEEVLPVVEIPTELLNNKLGLTRVSFSVLNGRRGIWEDNLTDDLFLQQVCRRVTNPYYGIWYSGDPDPNAPRKRKKRQGKPHDDSRFLADHDQVKESG